MFGFGKDKNTVHVEFYEAGNSAPFAVSDVPIEQLPDSFEIDTTLQMSGSDWQVVESDPKNKAEFKKTGKLKVVLTKYETTSMDPNEILYSLPTISNAIAATEEASSLENVAVFLEDDWRQFEFLAKSLESEIEKELKEIINIYEKHKEGVGFKEIHLRTKVPNPLPGTNLKLEALIEHFGISRKYSGVAFNTAPATIKNGFAFLSKANWLFWGQADDNGNIVALNISQVKESELSLVAPEIDEFLAKNELFLVDWLRVFWAGKDKVKFSNYGK